MKTLILYDSFFGNTEKIAFSMRDRLSALSQVICDKVVEANRYLPEEFDLFIAGSPTRGFRPSKLMMQYMNKLSRKQLEGIRLAAFDTRIDAKSINSRILHFLIRLFGYAAGPLAGKLHSKGGILIADPEGFIVEDSQGPLREGELERAANWAAHLTGH